jgi:pyrroline-5-carboxylate reductase
MAKQVLLIGCGRMGAALLKGWLASGAVENPIVVEPMPSSLPAGVKAVPLLTDVAGLLPDTILLAVKPQMLDEVLPALKTRLPKGALVISIAAGKTLSYFNDRLGPNVKIVRTMPNTPAAIGRGITVCCAGAGVTAAQRAEADGLMRAVGEVEWVEDESFMHAVTALSGSGPAYVFLLIQALSEAGIAAGLPADLSACLAKATVAGSGALAVSSSDDPAKLRADVTSPGGTTAAALAVLMGEGGLPDIMTRAVAAATARSKELAKG